MRLRHCNQALQATPPGRQQVSIPEGGLHVYMLLPEIWRAHHLLDYVEVVRKGGQEGLLG